MRAERGDEMAERTKCGGRGRTRQLFFRLESFFQRQVRVARLAVIVAVSAIAFLLGIVLFSYGSRLYEDWRETRLLDRATALLQEGKLSKAAQTARELVARHPDFVPALYVLAEAAEKQNREEAVSWRQQIARLLPTDLDSQLNLASAALRFGKLDLARQALDRVPANDRDSAAYHVVAGWLARAEGNFAGQEEQFAAAVKKEPSNDLYQFNLAALQIRSKDSEKSARERDTLQQQTVLRNNFKCPLRSHSAIICSV
jgi:predicted Zn-dependent protease